MTTTNQTFADKVVGAATQGAAGAVVAAAISSVTEPVVNRVLVNRVGIYEAMAQVDFETTRKFFNTTLATNFVKFPFFEITNIILDGVEIPPTARGATVGAVFTTTTLPITNYRYCKSMGQEVDFSALYKAYLPTVARDVVYGMCRNNVVTYIIQKYPELNKTPYGRSVIMFFAVLVACLVSAPGNEVRGYYLQNPKRRLPFVEFFQPIRFLRSTIIGALTMSTAMGIGTYLTARVQGRFKEATDFLGSNPIAKTILALFVFEQLLASSRHSELLQEINKQNQRK